MKLELFFPLIIAFLIWSACHSESEVASNNQPVTDVADQESWDATLTTTSHGKISSKIHYSHMEKYSKRKLVKFHDGVEIDFYDEDGNLTSNVHSDRAVLNERSKTIELIGNVVVKSKNGIDLNTEKLIWNESKDKVFSEELVTVITAESDTLYGTGFEADKDLKNWILKKPSGSTQKNLNIRVSEQ